jgi:hypothetical protein
MHSLILLAVAAASAAAPPDMAVFGVQLGKPLSYPECTWGPEDAEHLCMGTSTQRGAGVSRVGVYFPDTNAPLITKVARIDVTVFAGKVVAISFDTDGTSSTSLVLSALTEKYGQPSSKHAEAAQTAMGAQVEAISAEWKLSGLTVVYKNVAGRIDTGNVEITTPEGTAATKAALDAFVKKHPAL